MVKDQKDENDKGDSGAVERRRGMWRMRIMD